MFRIIFIMAVSVPSFLFAKVTTFECSFEKYTDGEKLYFQISDLNDSEKADYVEDAYKDFEGEDTPFSYDGEEVEWLWYALALDEIDYFEFNEQSDLIMEIDDVSCEVGKLHLYKNNGYRFGYVSVDHNCSEPAGKREDGSNIYPKTFSKVSCKLN